MTLNKVTRIPLRVFGPIPSAYVSDVIEDTLNDNSLVDTLTRFLQGDIEPHQMAHEIQIVMEANYQRRWPINPRNEAGEL
jgi:hypothetical protein